MPEIFAIAYHSFVGSSAPVTDLFALAGLLGIKGGLRAIGMPQDGIDRAADLAIQNPYWNPRPIERDAIRELLARAWAGAPPEIERM